MKKNNFRLISTVGDEMLAGVRGVTKKLRSAVIRRYAVRGNGYPSYWAYLPKEKLPGRLLTDIEIKKTQAERLKYQKTKPLCRVSHSMFLQPLPRSESMTRHCDRPEHLCFCKMAKSQSKYYLDAFSRRKNIVAAVVLPVSHLWHPVVTQPAQVRTDARHLVLVGEQHEAMIHSLEIPESLLHQKGTISVRRKQQMSQLVRRLRQVAKHWDGIWVLAPYGIWDQNILKRTGVVNLSIRELVLPAEKIQESKTWRLMNSVSTSLYGSDPISTSIIKEFGYNSPPKSPIAALTIKPFDEIKWEDDSPSPFTAVLDPREMVFFDRVGSRGARMEKVRGVVLYSAKEGTGWVRSCEPL